MTKQEYKARKSISDNLFNLQCGGYVVKSFLKTSELIQYILIHRRTGAEITMYLHNNAVLEIWKYKKLVRFENFKK
jgi:hypothetical protein